AVWDDARNSIWVVACDTAGENIDYGVLAQYKSDDGPDGSWTLYNSHQQIRNFFAYAMDPTRDIIVCIGLGASGAGGSGQPSSGIYLIDPNNPNNRKSTVPARQFWKAT